MESNLENIRNKIEKAIKKGFIEIIKSSPTIYAFALCSDENCESLHLAANTFEYLENAKEEYEEEESDHYSKYSPEEWDYRIKGADKEFDEINSLLSKKFLNTSFNNQEDEKKFIDFQNLFYNLCIEILIKLKKENFFFKNIHKEVFLTFSVSEFEFEISKQKAIIRDLNDNDYFSEYIEWVNT